MFRTLMIIAAVATILGGVNPAQAGDVEIVDAKVRRTANATYAFDVTLRHTDAGWDHYANKWDVIAPNGTLLGERILHHPHVKEQPFTRSLGGVKIPTGTTEVVIRAYDKVHGRAAATKTVPLTN